MTRLAAEICGMPIALVTLLDHRRQWFKSKIGIEVSHISRDLSFCRFALDSPDLLLVPDTHLDPRFAGNPLVTDSPFIRSYAAAPLITPDGDILGTLCVADTQPHTLSPEQQSALQTLSRQVMAQMELWRRLADLERTEAAHRRDAEALHRSEEQYRLLFVSNPNPMWVFDRETLRILAVNDAAVVSYGYARDEFLQLTTRDLRPEEHIPGLEAALKSLPQETSRSGIQRHRRKDGALLWADVTSHSLAFENRECRMVTALNVTDRHEAEEALRQKNSLLQAATESISDALFVKDLTGRYLLINSSGAVALGRPIEDILGRTDAELSPPETAERTRANDQRILSTGLTESYENATVGGRTFRSTKGVYRDAEGKIAGVFGISRDITAQRQVDRARRQAEERLQQLADVVEYSSEAIISKTPDDIILSWNAGAERLYGYRADEAIGQRFGEIVPPAVSSNAPSLLARLHAGEHISRVETARLDRWGRHVDITVSISPIRDAEGQVRAISSIATDITARKQTEQALQTMSERLRLVVGSAPLVLFALDEHGTFTLSEGKGLERLGLTPGQAVGQSVWDLYRESPTLLASLRRAYAGESLATVEQVGAMLYDSHYAPLRDEAGRVIGVLGIASDITERRAAEMALRESESMFRSAFDNAPIGMTLCDIEGRYVQVNPAFCRLIGYSPNELLQLRFQQITHPDDLTKDTDAHQEMKSGRIRGYTLEKRYFHKAGHFIWVQISVSLVRDGQGGPLYSIAQIQDITQRRDLEEEQERLQLQTEALLSEAIERADRDPLTGLLNHRVFHKRLDEECESARLNDTQISILMVDLDNFKFFNDAYGHLAGDEVLRRVSSALSACVRPGDTLARFGGDEFALLLPGLDEDAACALIQQARSHLEDAGYRPEGSAVSIPLTLSTGIAVWPQGGMTRLEAVEHADERLRLNKTGAEDMQADHIRTHMGRSLEGFTMLDALVTAVDNKDRYTRRHSDDVLTYSTQIAQELGLDMKTQETVAVAALLHDVGKISVPDRILRKPGKLTEEEFEAIKQHPMMGAIIVGAVPGLEETLDAVRHHHERWDGGGYPFGLRGEGTPLIARLMAVADAFSAMTTDRPYRKGMPHEKALKILEEGAGTQWDPVCVEAFLQARRAG